MGPPFTFSEEISRGVERGAALCSLTAAEALPQVSHAGHRPNHRAAACPQSEHMNSFVILIQPTVSAAYDNLPQDWEGPVRSDAWHLMLVAIASSIMPRTTVNLDPTILRELKAHARKEGKSLGRAISDIAAAALKPDPQGPERDLFTWRSRHMGPRIDLEDKEAVTKALGDP